LVSLLVIGFAGDVFGLTFFRTGGNSGSRTGVLSVSGGSQSGSFSCGTVSKSQDACASRNRSSPLAVCVPAPTVCAQAVYYAGAAVGGIVVGGLTIYSLDSYGRNFRYETPSNYQTPYLRIPTSVIGWTSYDNLLKHFGKHGKEMKDVTGVPLKDPKDFDKLCRSLYNRGRQTYKDSSNDTFVRYQHYWGDKGILTIANEKGEMVGCQPKSHKQFQKQVGKRYIPVN
jgi:hypothetical protein